jgi:hypothetical protein
MPALLFMCVAMSAHEAQAQGLFLEGNELAKFMRDWDKYQNGNDQFGMFATGTFGGYVLAVSDTAEHLLKFFVTPEGATRRQLCAVVSKFLKEHPERWSEPAFLLVINALQEAFPKK